MIMKLLLALILAFSASILWSQRGFTENIGQIKNQYGKKAEEVLFTYHDQDVRVSLRDNGFSYEVIKPTKTTKKKLSDIGSLRENFLPEFNFHRIDFEIESSGFKVEKSNLIQGKRNFLSKDNILTPNLYEKVTYKNVQKGLHIEFLISPENTFKYNIISEKNHKLENFKIKINGASNTFLENDELVLETVFGAITESIPVSFLDNDNKKVETKVKYKLEDNILSFTHLEGKDNKNLIIDPEPYIDWSTYYGGNNFSWGKNTAADSQGDVYQTGFTASTTNISTTGVHQENFSGDMDGFLTKFDEDGNLEWGTYFGGPQSDRVEGLSIDDQDRIYVSGSTFSESGIATTGVVQPFLFGQDDAFVMEFDQNGQRIWGTYLGGSAHDYAVCLTHSGSSLYVAGHTTSSNNIATSGAFLENTTGNEHGFIIKLNDDGTSIDWGTYVGSNGNTSVEGLSLLENGNLVTTGRTTAPDDITTTGAHQENFSGFNQAFLMVFEPNGTLDWGTYYGGDFSNRGNDVAVLDNEIYLVGNTNSNNNIATAGAYQTSRTDEHGFMAKFDDSGSRIWGTYVGGNLEDGINSVDARNELIILAGFTRSTQDISSPNAHQENHSGSGSADGFFKGFSPNGDFIFGSYLGGGDTERMNAIKFHSDQKIIFTGQTSGSNGSLTFGNSFEPNYPGGQEAIFNGLIYVPCVAEISGDGTFEVCENEEIILTATANNDVEWFESGTLIGTGSNLALTPTNSKTIEAITTDYVNCKDTAIYIIDVEPLIDPSFDFNNYCHQASNGPTNIVNPGGTFAFDPTPSGSASIDPSTGVISDGQIGDVFSVRYISDGNCPDTSYQQVEVLELDDPSFEYNSTCDGDIILPDNVITSNGTYYFATTPVDGANIDANTGEVTNYTTGTVYEIGYETPSSSCQNADTILVEIFNLPVVDLGGDFEICENDGVANLSPTPSGGNLNGTGIVNNDFNPEIAGIGTFEITYFYEDANNCSNSDTIEVEVLEKPVVDIGDDLELCVYNESISITPTPDGGDLSGPGLEGNIFSPSQAGEGEHTITYLFEAVNGCQNTDTMTITVDECLSILDNETSEIRVFPNPSSDKFFIEADTQITRIKVQTTEGRTILNKEVSSNGSEINLNKFSPGNYILRVNTMKGVKEFKLTKL